MKSLWKICAAIVLLAAAHILAPLSASAAQPERISVTYCQDCVPFHFTDDEGQPAGLIIDQWRMWSEKTGIKINFIAAPWNETLRMVGAGEADAHAGLFYNEERDKFLDYGAALSKTDTHYFIHRDMPPIDNLEDLGAYRVGVLTGDYVEGFLKQKIPESSVVGFQSYQDIMDALKAGHLNAFAADTLTALHHLQREKLSDTYQFPSSKPLYQNDWLVAVKQGDAELLKIINDGMGKITPEERSVIAQNWASSSVEKDKNILVISISSDYPPFIITGFNGEPRGLFVDLWQLWSETTGTPIRFLSSGWQGTLDSVKSGAADIHVGLFENDERSTWLGFSDPIHEVKTAIYFLSNSKNTSKHSEFYKERVGSVTGSYQAQFLKDQYGDINHKNYETTLALISALLNDEVDFIVGETPNIDGTIQRLGLQRDVSRGFDELLSNFIHAGVLKGNENLLKKINEGFQVIPFEKLAELDALWMPNPDHRFYRKAVETVELTREEEDWLAVHPFIRLAVTSFINPVDIVDAEGNYSGMNADLMTLINKKLGTRIVPEIFDKWGDVAENTLSGNVDGAFSFSRTPEREKHVYFTKPYAYDPIVVIARQGDEAVRSWNDLTGKTVSVAKGFSVVDELRRKVGDGELVLIDSDDEGLKLLSEGKTDAHVTFQLPYANARKNTQIAGLRIVDAKNTESGAFRIAVHKDQPILFSIIQKGVNALTRGELSALQNRWLTPKRPQTSSDFALTKEEREWLVAHPKINVGVMQSWPPFHITDVKGTRSGISMDILKRINDRLNGQLNAVPGEWKQLLEEVKNGSLDAVMDLTPMPKRMPFYNFTPPYLSVPHVIIARRNGPKYPSENDLIGKTVAIERGFGNVQYFHENFPGINILEVDDTQTALDAVSDGSVTAYAGNRAVASYLIQQDFMTDISVHGRIKTSGSVLAIGSRKDAPILSRILDKALASISTTEMSSLVGAYVDVGTRDKLIEEDSIKFSDEERIWLGTHQTVRVMVGTWPPFQFMDKEKPRGLALDYVRHILESQGFTIEYVPISFKDALEGISKLETVDMLPTIARSAEREKLVTFTQDYLSFPRVIFARKNNAFGSLNELHGKTVAVERGFITASLLKKDHPEINLLEVDTTKDALEAVSFSKADAFVSNMAVGSYLIDNLGLTNLSVSGQTDYKSDIQAMGVRKDWPELASIIDKSLAAMSATQARDIRQPWITLDTSALGQTKRAELSAEERQWLQDHPVIRVGNETDWPPFDFAKNGTAKGMSIDIMDVVAKKVGTRVEYTNGYSWVELMAMFKAGELDVLPAIYQSEDRLKYMVFTDSYATNPSVLAIHRKNSAFNSLDKLAGKKVGIVAGFVTEELLAKTYPDVNVVSIKNIEDGLFKVSAGEIDATFGSLGVISNLIETKFIPNISISFNTGLNVDATTELRMAALQENVILRDILQKGLDAISPEEMRAIRSKWMSVEAMSGGDAAKAQPPEIVRTQSSRGLWLTVGAAVLIFIGLIAFIKILLRSSKGDAVALQMGSKRFRFMIIGTVLLLALLVCSVSWLTFNHNKNRIIEANGVNLQTVLNNTVERVLIWIAEGKAQVAHSGRDPQLVTLTKALLTLPQDKKSLQFSKALSDIRMHIRDQDQTVGSQGFFIITPDGISIGSMRNENLASKNLIAIQKPDLFKQVAGGTAVFIPPIRSDVHLEAGANGPALPPTMFFAAPIVDEDGTVLAVLTNRVAPGRAFTRGVQTGYIGETGETYAFDASGLMMSSSRFEDDLTERGVLEKGQSSILNIVLSPPSANDPTQLTFMAQSAVSGRSGINLDGYEDYRGVKTIGTWVWLDQLGLGLATEIDATEVFEIVDTLKRTILIVLGLTLTLSMGATLFTLSLGERTSASLIRAKEELEGRVLERTKEVQRQRDLITAVMDSMTVGVAAFDNDLKLIAWNQKYLDIRGYPDELVFDGASFEDLIRHDIENDEFGPGDPEQIFAEKMNHAHKFESHAFDRKRPNGTFIEVLGGPIEGGGFVSTYADITERKQTERALNMAVDENKRQTARFRNLTNNLPAMVFQFMALGPEQIHITYASPFMSDTFEFGDTDEDEITELFYDRLHPDDDNRVRMVFAEIIANKGFLNETFRIQKTDGQVRWLEAAARSYEVTDGFMQWDGLILDITERKQAEQKLQAAEEHTRLILESAGEGVFGLDTKGVMTFVNPSACRMLGFSSEDIIGQAMHPLIHHTYADGSPYPAKQCYMRKAFIDGEVHHVADEVLWREDGTSFPVEYASTPIRKDGELLGAVVTFSDVTKRKQAEEEIVEARDKAEAATKSKAAFLAAMSHEIRTPMNGVVGMISLLQETQLESDQRTMMNTVQDSAFSLLQIINDILDFSKIEAGKLTLEKIPVNIDTVMEGVSETLLPNVAKKNLRMSLFIDPDIPEHVLTDQVRLRQILFNLAGNATKFTENSAERQGVVTLRAELTEPVTEGRTHIRFSVMDNGIGMKPEAVDKLFTPFTQADQSTTRRFGGTGLGLSICKTLADLMGGVINVESTEGEGSAFHVTLPFDIAEQADDHIRSFDLSGLNIAYAVKYDDTAEAVERYATANGARVTRFPAADIVANATALAISDPLDIIILGTLEDGQGREAIIETLRDDANVPGPRFVLLSDDRAEGRGMVLPDKVVVACAPVRKTGFLHGVAMAAGRASPEIENTAPKLGADARKAPTIEEARVAGELILVAEDNVTNQDVIRRQLNVLGYACEVADDGMIALEMLKGCPYGMLLTDCHMPNMDGYELTGALRNLELDADKRLPVVAITANALQGEAERCLASGMDDYLAKPLEMNKLKAMLGKWLPVDHGDATDAPVAEAAPAADTPTDADGDPVVNVKALTDMFGDDQEMLKEILGDYIEPSSNIIGEIDAGYEAHDAEAIGKAGHKLKSSSRAIGADALADLCAALEKAGKGGDWDEIEKLHPDLRSTFDAVILFIENL